ncbi:hypothetical protein NKH70_33880 [Mesorhizobium sp. M0991]|uniref:hypothetical protein n=1 Tax=Mesorhizobium sp. M0991 TaxID=2957043 RepID=UPI003339F8FD
MIYISGSTVGDHPQTRITIIDLAQGVYSHTHHAGVADRAMRRYHPYSFDFDSTPMLLHEPGETWDDEAKTLHAENREKTISRIKDEYGTWNQDANVQNIVDPGAKPMSLVAYHNRFYHQARQAFVVGAYYPALVAACALGVRILDHLVLDLRGSFKSSPHYKNVYLVR